MIQIEASLKKGSQFTQDDPFHSTMKALKVNSHLIIQRDMNLYGDLQISLTTPPSQDAIAFNFFN